MSMASQSSAHLPCCPLSTAGKARGARVEPYLKPDQLLGEFSGSSSQSIRRQPHRLLQRHCGQLLDLLCHGRAEQHCLPLAGRQLHDLLDLQLTIFMFWYLWKSQRPFDLRLPFCGSNDNACKMYMGKQLKAMSGIATHVQLCFADALIVEQSTSCSWKNCAGSPKPQSVRIR